MCRMRKGRTLRGRFGYHRLDDGPGRGAAAGSTQFYVDQDGSDLPVEQSLRVNWKYLSQLNF